MMKMLKIFSVFLFLLSSIRMNGQDDYTRQFEIMSQTMSMLQEDRAEEALSLLRSNRNLYTLDQATEFLYAWLNAGILYHSGKFSECQGYLSEAISFLDANPDVLSDPNMTRFLSVYYYLPDVDYRLGMSYEQVVTELERAKFIYEKANATTDPVYSCVISKLNSLKDNIVEISTQAMNALYRQDYHSAIPIIKQIINYSKANRSTDYNDTAFWMRLLALAYTNIGDYNNSEQYYLSALEILENNHLQNEQNYRGLLDDMSSLCIHMQNFDRANELNGKAKTLFEEAMDFGDGYVRCLNNAALIQHGLGYNIIAKMLIDVALRQSRANLSDSTKLSSAIPGLEQFSAQPINDKELKFRI